MRYKPKNKADVDKISQALQKMTHEDLTIRVVNDAENRQTLLYGMGDQHLDIVVSRLLNEYKVEIELSRPKIAYKETIKKQSDVEYKSNETGSILCFVKEGELWCYNATEKKLSQVFSFRGYEGIDSRENHKEHDIRIIKVDETGSADFVVYGYMNRGNHEGQVGVGVYHYDSVANTVEEELFIPSTHSYEVLKSELGQLMYENESGMFYIMMGGTLYEINLATTKEKEVVSGFETGNYAVSENNQFVAYIADGNSDSGSKITVLNLENSKSFEVAAAAGTYIRPLAFMEDDFIYGEADDSDVYTDSAGNVQFPMNHIYIVDTDDEEHGVLKDYHKDGYYVASVEVVDYTIYLNREQYNGMAYVPAEQDTIMNREGDSAEVVSIHSTVSGTKTDAAAAAIITGRRDKLGSSADSEADCIGVAEKCESERTGRDRLLLCLFCRKSSAGNG